MFLRAIFNVHRLCRESNTSSKTVSYIIMLCGSGFPLFSDNIQSKNQ